MTERDLTTESSVKPALRDRVEGFIWRLFWSRYTSWRQDRAFQAFRKS